MACLGHSLEEIRVRALQNILSKLDYGLVCNSDLVHERHLHIRLLEWFNFASCPLQDRVLGLILRLSEVLLLMFVSNVVFHFHLALRVNYRLVCCLSYR